MSSTDRRTDGQTDRRTRWIQYTPPPTSLGGGIITVEASCILPVFITVEACWICPGLVHQLRQLNIAYVYLIVEASKILPVFIWQLRHIDFARVYFTVEAIEHCPWFIRQLRQFQYCPCLFDSWGKLKICPFSYDSWGMLILPGFISQLRQLNTARGL